MSHCYHNAVKGSIFCKGKSEKSGMYFQGSIFMRNISLNHSLFEDHYKVYHNNYLHSPKIIMYVINNQTGGIHTQREITHITILCSIATTSCELTQLDSYEQGHGRWSGRSGFGPYQIFNLVCMYG